MAGEADAERLVVLLEARIRDFEKNMAKASATARRDFGAMRGASKSATRSMETDIGRATATVNRALAATSARFGTFGKNMIAGFAGGLVAGGLAGIVGRLGQVARGVASIGDEAKRAGVDVRSFQELAYVAEQNRIEVGALTDGLKELNLRADEFIVTGGGSAAEAFQRLGYSADELSQKLQDPSALFTEIIGKLHALDRAAAIRIADEIFGGQGGEQFVQLINQGADGITRLRQEAREAGRVLSEETVAKAAEVDRKFNQIADTIGIALKGAIIEATDALLDFLQAMPDTPARALGEMRDRAGELTAEITELVAHAVAAFPDLTNELGVVYEGIRSNTMEAGAAKDALLALARANPDFAPIAGDLNGLIALLANVRAEAQAAAHAISLGMADDVGIMPEFADVANFGKTRTVSTGGGAKSTIQRLNSDYSAFADDGIAKIIDAHREWAETLSDEIVGGVSSVWDAFAEGQDVLTSLLDLAADLGKELALSGVKQLLMGALGAGSLGGGWNIPTSYVPGGFFPGFAGGGYTGPGRHDEIAGAVHRGEVVWSQDDVARAGGVGAVESMRRGNISPTAAPAITIAPNYSIDARGSAMTERQFAALLDRSNRQLRRDLPAMIADARRRGEI